MEDSTRHYDAPLSPTAQRDAAKDSQPLQRPTDRALVAAARSAKSGDEAAATVSDVARQVRFLSWVIIILLTASSLLLTVGSVLILVFLLDGASRSDWLGNLALVGTPAVLAWMAWIAATVLVGYRWRESRPRNQLLLVALTVMVVLAAIGSLGLIAMLVLLTFGY